MTGRKTCITSEAEGARHRGRPRTTWKVTVDKVMDLHIKMSSSMECHKQKETIARNWSDSKSDIDAVSSIRTANSSCNSWRPRLSGVCGAGVEQSASTDQGRLVAVVFSAADKGPSVSAVVQLTSDYCLPSFFLISDM